MKKAITLSLLMLACLIIGYGIGFYKGNTTNIDESTITKYITGPTISGTADSSKFELVKEEKPTVSKMETVQSGIYKPSKELSIPSNQVIDTAAIIASYELRRTYKAMVFDSDTLGKLVVYPVIQHNSLAGLDYNFTPVYREKIITRTKVFQPFLSASYSTMNYVGIGGGVFYHDIGVEYQYQKSLGNMDNGHMVGVKVMF